MGHDENIDFAAMCAIVGEAAGARLRDLSLRLYREAAALRRAARRDRRRHQVRVRPASTARIVLIDEALTPDSSRFWPAADHRPGEEPPSWDKQILRNHLETARLEPRAAAAAAAGGDPGAHRRRATARCSRSCSPRRRRDGRPYL